MIVRPGCLSSINIYVQIIESASFFWVTEIKKTYRKKWERYLNSLNILTPNLIYFHSTAYRQWSSKVSLLYLQSSIKKNVICSKTWIIRVICKLVPSVFYFGIQEESIENTGTLRTQHTPSVWYNWPTMIVPVFLPYLM